MSNAGQTKKYVQDQENYWNNRLNSYRDFSGVGYLGLGINYNRWLYRIRRHVFLQQIRYLELDFTKTKILDVGSGTGFYTGLWKAKGARSIIGSDISDYAVNKLRSGDNSTRVIKLDISSNLKDQSFYNEMIDVVSAFDVLFHIVNEDNYVKAIYNISEFLKKGGYFIFSENFSYENKKGEHQAQRKEEDIIKILSQNKLKLIKKAPMFVIMNYPVNSKSAFWLAGWKVLEKVIRLSEFSGWLIGVFLFPIEIFLLSIAKSSYSTSIAICQKE